MGLHGLIQGYLYFSFTIYKGSINPITNHNPVSKIRNNILAIVLLHLHYNQIGSKLTSTKLQRFSVFIQMGVLAPWMGNRLIK
jgi:hypothetical protein